MNYDEDDPLGIQAEIHADALAAKQRRLVDHEDGPLRCRNQHCHRKCRALRMGRCDACYMYLRRTGRDRGERPRDANAVGRPLSLASNKEMSLQEKRMAKPSKVVAATTHRPDTNCYYRLKKAPGGICWVVAGVRITDKGVEHFTVDPEDIYEVTERRARGFMQEAERRAS